MIGSYALYIGVLSICWLCACLANRCNRKIYVWAIIAVLTLLAGLRSGSVGMDTANYLQLFETIDSGQFHLAYGLENSFKYIVYGILRLVPGTQFLLVIFGWITNWCIITRFWELRKVSSFVCMVLCYYMSFFFLSLNAMRQFVAVGIVFYSTRYLTRKKPLYFIFGVLLAMQFHRSAVIGFGMLVMNCIRWKEFPKYQKVLYVLSAILSPVMLAAAMQIFGRYAKYFSNPTMDVGLMLLLKLAFLAVSALFVFGIHPGDSYFRNGQMLNSDDRYQIRIGAMSYFVALLLAVLGYIFPYAERISLCYYLFEGVYFGVLLKGKNPVNRLLFGYVIAFVIGYGFLYSMANNSQGTMPYGFFWQSVV